jgi:hypothetical protein
MSYFKIAFWAIIILLLVPTGGGAERSVLFSTVQRTFADLSGFCTRNPDVCSDVASSFDGIGEKLSDTAQTIESLLYQAGIGADRSQLHKQQVRFDTDDDDDDNESSETTSSLGQDTLTNYDRRPDWRGPRYRN